LVKIGWLMSSAVSSVEINETFAEISAGLLSSSLTALPLDSVLVATLPTLMLQHEPACRLKGPVIKCFLYSWR